MSKYCPHCLSMIDDKSVKCPECGKETKTVSYLSYLPVGTKLDGNDGHSYIIGRVLGDGDFSITYIAKDTVNGQIVVIKEYFPYAWLYREGEAVRLYKGHENEFFDGKARYLNEMRALRPFNRLPSIEHTLDAFEANGTAYAVTEYLDGVTLKEYVDKNGKLPFGELLSKVRLLMNDLSTLHEAGIIHYDISPDNIMLLPDGTLKLLNSYHALALDLKRADYYSSEPHYKLYYYRPVEWYTEKGAGPHTDVYSLCATMYYCLTCKKPPQSIDRIMSTVPLERPISLGAVISEENEEVLLWGMEVIPVRRPKTFTELMEKFDPAAEEGLYLSIEEGLYLSISEPPETHHNPKKTVPKKALIIGVFAAVIWIMIGIAVCAASGTSKHSEINYIRGDPLRSPFVKLYGEDTIKTITKVSFRDTLSDMPPNAKNTSDRISDRVMSWLDGSELIIAADGMIAIRDASHLFESFTSLETVDFNECFDTSYTNNMRGMFRYCTSLTSIDLSGFDTKNVTNMSGMFDMCSSLTSLDLSSFDTNNVTDMKNMFFFCYSLKTLTVDENKFVINPDCDTTDMYYFCDAIINHTAA